MTVKDPELRRRIREKIKYIRAHRKAIRDVAKEYLGCVPSYIRSHDMEKIRMLRQGMDPKEVSRIHRAHSPHHPGSDAPEYNYDEMIFDWESAPRTKPDKPWNAYETMKRFHPDLEPILLPRMKELGMYKGAERGMNNGSMLKRAYGNGGDDYYISEVPEPWWNTDYKKIPGHLKSRLRAIKALMGKPIYDGSDYIVNNIALSRHRWHSNPDTGKTEEIDLPAYEKLVTNAIKSKKEDKLREAEDYWSMRVENVDDALRDLMAQEKSAEMSRDRIQAQYARHPQSSLDALARRLAKNKWGVRDVVREDAAHAEEFGVTGEDKEYLDRYIIARIAERYDRRARAKQAVLRSLWEKNHNGESFDAALPARMARFRQYEGTPFGNYSNPIEQRKYDSQPASMPDGAWDSYLKTAEFIKKADPKDLTPNQSHPERNKGLNSPNPYVRTLNKEFGYVAPHPHSKQFVNTKEFNPSTFMEDSPYYKQMTWLTKQDPRGRSGFPTFFDSRHPMNRLAMYDLARTQGNPNIRTSYYPGGTPDKSVIMQGPWPSNEKSVRHEVGHYIDHSRNGLPSGVVSPQDRIRHEETAWDLAGIQANDPQRQLALAGYQPNIGMDDAIELTKNLTAEQARTYAPPSSYIGKYTRNGYPIAYDYPSLVQAYNRNPGLVSRILASWNEKDKMVRPYVTEAYRWYRDHGAEQR